MKEGVLSNSTHPHCCLLTFRAQMPPLQASSADSTLLNTGAGPKPRTVKDSYQLPVASCAPACAII